MGKVVYFTQEAFARFTQSSLYSSRRIEEQISKTRFENFIFCLPFACRAAHSEIFARNLVQPKRETRSGVRTAPRAYLFGECRQSLQHIEGITFHNFGGCEVVDWL